ncbi:hypothetical protein FHS45_000114 [Thalassobacillus devorans]|uniref:hypothetical protein n=1 Tax=Thalassobacillus devorans TaxID=279813 RepID=UPI00141B21DB|nr:hypothetical protein [Thalassobacillus devorans]NIK27023.1 hypothetical protein [Thalassobacillus devorans]
MKHQELSVGTMVRGCKLGYIYHLIQLLCVIYMHSISQKPAVHEQSGAAGFL